ncbi:hypothetical protein CHELA1G11_12930 [Hyphomicrobiales bacterium]|nr:hypothetical protein CHELA1G2_11380 [Hyphomicrobiales bacterium]CAH1668117.1 hypothetical protein CHELA1G11_12930 [Hyphomicrobiales bacterium]
MPEICATWVQVLCADTPPDPARVRETNTGGYPPELTKPLISLDLSSDQKPVRVARDVAVTSGIVIPGRPPRRSSSPVPGRLLGNAIWPRGRIFLSQRSHRERHRAGAHGLGGGDHLCDAEDGNQAHPQTKHSFNGCNLSDWVAVSYDAHIGLACIQVPAIDEPAGILKHHGGTAWGARVSPGTMIEQLPRS